ncbi:tubulin binding cofactor C-domain-containing protein [Russula dissimulans]|nr:tubulin binding cofactor C-domain-containing protein [Russula dissimulans]
MSCPLISINSGLVTRLEACRNDPTSHNDWQELALDTRKLRKSLTDATGSLSPYDQRQCQAQMDILEQTLEEIRSVSLPKTKFTFKRKTNNPPHPAAQSSSSSSRSAIESGEGDGTPATLSLQSIPTLGTGPPTSDLTISDLDHCIVDLCGTAEAVPRQICFTALHVHDLKETILILPNVKGSVRLHNLHRCTVIVACHQFRMHNSIDVRVYLAAVSNPVIEKCSAIAFAEYPSFVSQRNPSVNGELPRNGKHADVQDFSHIRLTPSPNWSLLSTGNENWGELTTLGDSSSSSPQALDAILARHLPETTSKDAT